MFELISPCLFGLEGPLGDELRHGGFADVRPENGRVRFRGNADDVARANIKLRMAERVLIEVGSWSAATFDELFEGTAALPWEDYIPKSGAFPVKGYSLNSALYSVPDCQKIIKKAVSKRLGLKYGMEWLPEDDALYQIQFSIMKDQVSVCIDTSGAGLHKRGYRPKSVTAPLRETLAAAIVSLTRYRGRGDFADPFCGTGTIPIEAALIAKNRAPGLKRAFAAEKFDFIGPARFAEARSTAAAAEFSGEYHIFASDIDPAAIELAEASAKLAGVDGDIAFEVSDARTFSRATERGIIASNPPYGERLLEKREAGEIYADFGRAMRGLSGWSAYILSSHTDFERMYGREADKKRKLYNGMIKCDLFIYR